MVDGEATAAGWVRLLRFIAVIKWLVRRTPPRTPFGGLSFVAMHLWRTRCSGDPVSACQRQPKTAEIVATIRETTNSQENASRKDSSLGLSTLRFPRRLSAGFRALQHHAGKRNGQN